MMERCPKRDGSPGVTFSNVIDAPRIHNRAGDAVNGITHSANAERLIVEEGVSPSLVFVFTSSMGQSKPRATAVRARIRFPFGPASASITRSVMRTVSRSSSET